MARNKHPEITEARILNTATRLFLEKGWEQTTIQDIVDESGNITRGAFYYHFKSKDEIIDAVTSRIFEGSRSLAPTEEMQGLNGLQKMKYALARLLQQGSVRQYNQAADRVLESPFFIGRRVMDSIRYMAPCFTEYIEEGIQDGSVLVKNPRQTAESMILLISVWLNPCIFPASKAEYLKKCEHLRLKYESIGLPLFDDEMQALLKNLYGMV